MCCSHSEVPMSSSPLLSDASVHDAELARRIGRDDEGAFEFLMRRNNSRLFRVARAILKDAADAEDVLQEAYLTAYRHIADFRADAKLSTWLTRIVINKALALRRKRHRDRIVVHLNEVRPDAPRGAAYAVLEESAESPEQSTTRTDMRRLLERKIDELPVAFRSVFALRELEERRGRGRQVAGRTPRTEESDHEIDWCRYCDKPVPHDRSGGRRGAQRRTDCRHRGHGEPGRHRRGQACRLEVAHQGRQGVRRAHDR
ncbi:MAG: sigma-70 family RNA polymerase sigma factor [Gammaproteobacteria bacterium]|nr:MAG: sigma-70 family RNA polymerase sigma factor [Gammaproteobacteria bacterium]